MWTSLCAMRLLVRLQAPVKPVLMESQVRLLHATNVNCRRKDLSAHRGNLLPEEEGVPGERSLQVSATTPIYPTLETHLQVFDGMVYTDIPIIYIKCSQNNTIMSIHEAASGNVLDIRSCGTEGFRNCKKGTNVAGQAVGLSLGKRALAKGQRTFRVAIKGLGPGRASSIKGLEMAGVNIVSITDRTPIPTGSGTPNKPRKARRV